MAQYWLVMDRQTDGGQTHDYIIYRAIIASSGKNSGAQVPHSAVIYTLVFNEHIYIRHTARYQPVWFVAIFTNNTYVPTLSFKRIHQTARMHVNVTEAHQVSMTSITSQQRRRRNKRHSSSQLCGTTVADQHVPFPDIVHDMQGRCSLTGKRAVHSRHVTAQYHYTCKPINRDYCRTAHIRSQLVR